MNYKEMNRVVTLILSKPDRKPLHFNELKTLVEKSGAVDHDRILEEVLVELKKRGNVSYDMVKGSLTYIRWN